MTAAKQRRVVTTDAEMDAAARAARERENTATKIVSVRFDRKRDVVVVHLSTGAALVVPRSLIPGFAHADPAALRDLTINSGAESLWSDRVDDGVLLEQLLEIAAGSRTLIALGGRLAGRIRTPARAAASRANGAKGGRPRKAAG